MKKHSLFKKFVASAAALTLAFSMVVVAPASALAATAKKPAAVKNVKLKRDGNTIIVKWKKQADSKADGYQVRYATNKAMKHAKTVTVKKASTNKAALEKLKTGTTYYVQVRAYKKAGKTLRGAWSKAKKTTVWYVNTGNKKLDKDIEQILAAKVKKTGGAGLKKAFDFVVSYVGEDGKTHCRTYLNGGSSAFTGGGEKAYKKWLARVALQGVNKVKSGANEYDKAQCGNCYEVAALFCCLAKGLGYDAKVICGKDTPTHGHGWVEIKKDGKTYVCDPNITWRFLDQPNAKIPTALKAAGYDLNSCYFMKPYADIPTRYYTKSGAEIA